MVFKRALMYVCSVVVAGTGPAWPPSSAPGNRAVTPPSGAPSGSGEDVEAGKDVTSGKDVPAKARWVGWIPRTVPTVRRTPETAPGLALDHRLSRMHYAVTETEMVPLWQDRRLFRAQVQQANAAQTPPTAQPPHDAAPNSRSAPHRKATTASSPVRQTLSSRSVTGVIQMDAGVRIAAIALSFIGARYVWGGESPDGFDCSGFVQYVYGKAGVVIPRTSYEQFQVGQAVGWGDLRPGDLLFFNTGGGGASHVAVYVGNGLMAQALNARTGVIVTHIDAPYFRSRFVGARRPVY
ncbi:C40 family peptidase [Alicyclobacillus macrosporangiidus]|uniref:Cell wall-associated hydrolase, NlpC family n=1 Tax=Alicyclobacillus macrosporangiidus TaxID=392015 RepID=A0A1I7KLS3_9BACL|nr:C40 family peptidase [Alicyclobacillus macrosporangiidus]SFU98346.1 Cell wall-associated hydrolase, NlpC family [Alicyclobacillus macrosporangiidus]